MAAPSRAWLSDMPPVEAPLDNGRRASGALQIAAALENWHAVAAGRTPLTDRPKSDAMPGFDRDHLEHVASSLLALAKAMLGDIAGRAKP